MSVGLRLCESDSDIDCGRVTERETKEKDSKRFTKKSKKKRKGRVEEIVQDRGEGIQRAVSY